MPKADHMQHRSNRQESRQEPIYSLLWLLQLTGCCQQPMLAGSPVFCLDTSGVPVAACKKRTALGGLWCVIWPFSLQWWKGGPGDMKCQGFGLVVCFYFWQDTPLRDHPFQYISGWWFGAFFIFPYIGNVIIPTDELIFFRGVGQPPTRYFWITINNHEPSITINND